MNLITLLRTVLNPSVELRIGMASSDGGNRFVFVAIGKDGVARMLWSGTELPWPLKMFFPLVISTDLGAVPVLLVSSELNGQEPDTWIDRNEEKTIPRGMTADDVMQEWCVGQDWIYAATVNKKQFDEHIQSLKSSRFIPSPVSIPLAGLGGLYWGRLRKPFVIWKITGNGSKLGYFVDGVLKAFCDYWASDDDLAADAEGIARDVEMLIDSLTNRSDCPVLIARPDAGHAGSVVLKNRPVIPAPEIQGIRPEYHEAYALTLNNPESVNFSPFEEIQTAKRIIDGRRTVLNIGGVIAVSLSVIVAMIGIGFAGVRIGHSIVDEKLAPVRREIRLIEGQKTTIDSLQHILAQQARFLSRESAITGLLTDLQTVFPDGVWSEEISISERSAGSWEIGIIALSYSSALVPVFLKNLGGIQGMSGVRMQYSEQTKVEKGMTAIRLKATMVWGTGG